MLRCSQREKGDFFIKKITFAVFGHTHIYLFNSCLIEFKPRRFLSIVIFKLIQIKTAKLVQP